jgi:hypothetical protein
MRGIATPRLEGLNDEPQTVDSVWHSLRPLESRGSIPIHFLLHFHGDKVLSFSNRLQRRPPVSIH